MMKDMSTSPAQAAKGSQEYIKDVSEIVHASDAALYLIEVSSTMSMGNYHAINVSMLSMLLGKAMGFDAKTVEILGLGALLHDVGKVKLPDEIRNAKTPKLSPPQKKLYERHPQYGVEIVQAIKDFPKDAKTIIFQHHEYIDGSGFPSQLTEGKISVLSQITALCNLYDKLVNSRHTDMKLTSAEVVSYSFKSFTQRINPKVLQAFVKTIGVYPPGTIVVLNDKRTGIVTSINQASLLNPNIMLYDPDVDRKQAQIINLADDPNLRVESTVRRDDVPEEVLDYFNLGGSVGFQVQKSATKS